MWICQTHVSGGISRRLMNDAEQNLFFFFPLAIESLRSNGIHSLMPIQAETIQKLREGCDVIARAKTGLFFFLHFFFFFFFFHRLWKDLGLSDSHNGED
jgi:hypothetical protein